jgi:hypothetical protein
MVILKRKFWSDKEQLKMDKITKKFCYRGSRLG